MDTNAPTLYIHSRVVYAFCIIALLSIALFLSSRLNSAQSNFLLVSIGSPFPLPIPSSNPNFPASVITSAVAPTALASATAAATSLASSAPTPSAAALDGTLPCLVQPVTSWRIIATATPPDRAYFCVATTAAGERLRVDVRALAVVEGREVSGQGRAPGEPPAANASAVDVVAEWLGDGSAVNLSAELNYVGYSLTGFFRSWPSYSRSALPGSPWEVAATSTAATFTSCPACTQGDEPGRWHVDNKRGSFEGQSDYLPWQCRWQKVRASAVEKCLRSWESGRGRNANASIAGGTKEPALLKIRRSRISAGYTPAPGPLRLAPWVTLL